MNSQFIAMLQHQKNDYFFSNKYYDKKNHFFFHFVRKKNVKNTLFIIKNELKPHFPLPLFHGLAANFYETVNL